MSKTAEKINKFLSDLTVKMEPLGANDIKLMLQLKKEQVQCNCQLMHSIYSITAYLAYSLMARILFYCTLQCTFIVANLVLLHQNLYCIVFEFL